MTTYCFSPYDNLIHLNFNQKFENQVIYCNTLTHYYIIRGKNNTVDKL